MSDNLCRNTGPQESFHAKLQEWASKWWLTFAQTLQVSDETINRLRLDMAVGLSLEGALDEILTDWIRRGMSEEEMNSFRNKLDQDDDKTIFNSSVFGRFTTDLCEPQVLEWSTLSKAVKGRVLTKPVYFCGETTTLLGIRQYMPTPECFDKILKTSINASQIQEFMQENVTILTKSENCHRYPYILPRTISVRLNISHKVFSKSHERDIFIVNKIEWNDLKYYAEHAEVIRSTNLDELDTASCVVLEDQDHLSRILKTMRNKNIHLLSYEDVVGENPLFIWEKTIGEGSVMLDHILSEDTLNFSEEDFINSHYSAKGTSTICLYGVSGIGKSTLLKNVYSRLLKDYQDRLLIFYSANQLLQDIGETREWSEETDMCSKLVNCIAKNYSRNALGESLLCKLLLSEYLFTELFIDSLDDIPPTRFNDLVGVLQALNSNPNSRLTIACAPVMMQMLTEQFPMIQCELLNLTSEEQCKMFQKYWVKAPEARCPKSLVQLSRKCCTKLVDNTSCNIVGTPLQIRLLGQIYQKKADEINSGSVQAVHILPTPVDIYKLFKKFINKTLNSDRQSIMNQANKSLIEYFPELIAGSLLLDKRDVGTDNDATVVLEHRISKQYFVATYLSQYMQDIPETKESSGIFVGVLDQVFEVYANNKINRTYSFVRFFLDRMCIELKSPPSLKFRNYLTHKSKSSNMVQQLATNGLFGLVYLIISSGKIDYCFADLTVSEYSRLVLTATKSGNKKVVEFICSQRMFTLEIFGDFPSTEEWKLCDIVMTPLHVAIRRGCLSLFHLFLEKYGSSVTTMKGLFHAAVEKTYDLHEEVILNKIQIIKYLMHKLVSAQRSDEDIVNEQIGDGITPLLMNRIHITLLSLLMRYGADPGVRENRSHNTVAHILPNYCSVVDFQVFVEEIDRVNQRHVLVQRNANHEAPYQIATRKLSLNTDVVDRIASILADYIELEQYCTDNFVYQLIKYGCNQDLISVALKYQSGWIQGRYKNNSTSLLHVAAEFSNVSATKHLLSLGLDVNMIDASGRTPLHVACTHTARTRKQLTDIKTIIEDLLANGADVSITDEDGKTALHYLNDAASVPSRKSSICSVNSDF